MFCTVVTGAVETELAEVDGTEQGVGHLCRLEDGMMGTG